MSGKMHNLKWRVGVAMSSNKCKSLGAPYVSLTFDVKETDGSSSQHSTELTYEQFKVIAILFDCHAFVSSFCLYIFVLLFCNVLQDFKASFEQVTAAMDEL